MLPVSYILDGLHIVRGTTTCFGFETALRKSNISDRQHSFNYFQVLCKPARPPGKKKKNPFPFLFCNVLMIFIFFLVFSENTKCHIKM